VTTVRRAAVLAVFALAGGAVRAAVFLTQAQALALAFPEGSKVERQAVFLTEVQLAKAKELAGPDVPVASALVTRYAGTDAAGKPVGTAYFDKHRVRTVDETLMVVVDPSGRASRIEVLDFDEPPDYLPKKGWLAQLLGKDLDDELRLKRGVRPITGASLSSKAATDAVRRILALHRVIP
jgi:hypothetical protein